MMKMPAEGPRTPTRGAEKPEPPKEKPHVAKPPRVEQAPLKEDADLRAQMDRFREDLVKRTKHEQMKKSITDEMKDAEDLFAKLHGGDLKAIAEGTAKAPGLFSRFASGVTKMAYVLSGRGNEYKSAKEYIEEYRELQRSLSAEEDAMKQTKPREVSRRSLGVERTTPVQSGGMGTVAAAEVMQRRGAMQLLGAYEPREAIKTTVEELTRPFVAGMKKFSAELTVLDRLIREEMEKAEPQIAGLKKDLNDIGKRLQALYGQLDDTVRLNIEQTPAGKKFLEKFQALLQYQDALKKLIATKRMTQPAVMTKPPEAIRPAEKRPTAETIPPPAADELSWASLPVETVVRPKPRAVPPPPPLEALPAEQRAIVDQAVRMLEHNPDASKRDALNKPEMMDEIRGYARTVMAYQQKIRELPKTRPGRLKELDPELFAHLAKLHKKIKAANAFLGLNTLTYLNMDVEEKILAETAKKETADSSKTP